MIVSTTVEPGRQYDLTVRFGNQTRTKCAACKHFMRVSPQPQVTCACGQQWIHVGSGRFEATR